MPQAVIVSAMRTPIGPSVSDVDLFEINEAFAAMCVATVKLLDPMSAGDDGGSATVIEVPAH
jgi:acetyl-CoA acetyltransferase